MLTKLLALPDASKKNHHTICVLRMRVFAACVHVSVTVCHRVCFVCHQRVCWPMKITTLYQAQQAVIPTGDPLEGRRWARVDNFSAVPRPPRNTTTTVCVLCLLLSCVRACACVSRPAGTHNTPVFLQG